MLCFYAPVSRHHDLGTLFMSLFMKAIQNAILTYLNNAAITSSHNYQTVKEIISITIQQYMISQEKKLFIYKSILKLKI